jgi:cell division protein FtsQ
VAHRAGLILLDEDRPPRGRDLAARRPADLPLIAGRRRKAVPEALALIDGGGAALAALRGLVRMGERRWDIVLDRDQRILLPADQPLRALERLIALDQAGTCWRATCWPSTCARARPVLRLAPFALTEMRRARGILPAGDRPVTDLYQSQRAMRHMRRTAMQRGVIAILDVGPPRSPA